MSLSLYRAATKKPFGMLSGGQRYVAKVSAYDMRWPSCAVCTMNELKPVAEIAADWSLRYIGSGPLAGLVRTNGLEREQKLFAIPDTHRVVSVEMLEGIVTTLMRNGYFCGDIRAIIDNKGEI